MTALISVLLDIIVIVLTMYFVYMWATTHDPNYGIMLLLTAVLAKESKRA